MKAGCPNSEIPQPKSPRHWGALNRLDRQALRLGAADYLVKPCSPDQLRLATAKQLEVRQLSARLEALEGAEINQAKVVLANEVTKLVRGEDAARAAEATAKETFAGGGAGEDLPSQAVGAEGMRIGALLTAIGFTASNGEAKRKLAEGAVKLDDEVVGDPGLLVEVAEGQQRKLSLGKKKHGILTR